MCAAHCTGEHPRVWWYPTETVVGARVLETALKRQYGEPPIPRARFSACINGGQLLEDLLSAAGPESWHAGFIEAVFAIGEKLNLVFQKRFDKVWERVGVPPGPWRR
jgi:hypothetical protein